jgi:hypothetical protein
VYCDLDVAPKRSISPLIEFFDKDDTTFTVALVHGPERRSNLHYSNFLMIGKPHAVFWEHYMLYVLNEEWSTMQAWYVRQLMRHRHYYVMATTGPAAVSAVQLSLMKRDGYNQHVMTIPSEFVNTTRIFQEFDVEAPVDDNLRFTHLPGRSWCDNSTRVAINAARVWNNRDQYIFPAFFIVLIVLIVISVLFARTRR